MAEDDPQRQYLPWLRLDRAPKRREVVVLVFDPTEGVCSACWGGERDGKSWWVPHPASHDGELLYPTHWMPLPEDPKEHGST